MRLASHAVLCTLLLYLVLHAVTLEREDAPADAASLVLGELAMLAQAARLGAVTALLAALALATPAPATRAAVPLRRAMSVLWGLTGLLAGGAIVDARFVLFFGRHVYHPQTIALLASPGSSDHSGVGIGRAASWAVAWALMVAVLVLFGRRLGTRTLGPGTVVVGVAIALAVIAAGELAVPGTASLDSLRASLFLRGLSDGREEASLEDTSWAYPRGTLGPPARGERPDLLLIVIESLRADVLEAETMPELSRLAASPGAFVGERHYAGANCTANSFYTLFYGTNGSTYVRFTDTTAPVASAPLAWLGESGYERALYTSHALDWQHMGELFVAPVFDVVVEETEGEVWERDARALDRYFADLDAGLDDGRTAPRFTVLFFTSSHHDYAFPEDAERFSPSLRPLDVMQTDLRPFRTELVNRYRNSVFYVDGLVGRAIDGLRARDRLSRTRVVITGDHGEEFLEHGHLTHASSLVEEQIHTPLVALGLPGLSGRTRALTSHAQIVPTLLASVSPDLAFDRTGTGTPMGHGDAIPIVSECADVPGMFVAIEETRKHWFTMEPGAIRFDFVSDGQDAILAEETTAEGTATRIRAALDPFGGDAHAEASVLWPCPSIDAGGARFYVCERWIAWAEASAFCRSHGLTLATFADPAQARAVARAATSEVHEAFWIGVNDRDVEGDFRSESGAVPAFTQWAEGEPSNGNGREHCVQVCAGGVWTDRVCEERERFVCGAVAP